MENTSISAKARAASRAAAIKRRNQPAASDTGTVAVAVDENNAEENVITDEVVDLNDTGDTGDDAGDVVNDEATEADEDAVTDGGASEFDNGEDQIEGETKAERKARLALKRAQAK